MLSLYVLYARMLETECIFFTDLAIRSVFIHSRLKYSHDRYTK